MITIDIIKKLYMEGYTIGEIAKKYDVTRQYISLVIRKNHLSTRELKILRRGKAQVLSEEYTSLLCAVDRAITILKNKRTIPDDYFESDNLSIPDKALKILMEAKKDYDNRIGIN